jgi:hypothetical protein
MPRTTLSSAEIDAYSIRLLVQSGLNDAGWVGDVPVKLATNGWPTADKITPPVVYIEFGDSAVAGVELGSNGESRIVYHTIYATNAPSRDSLATDIMDMYVAGKIAPLAFVTGSEASPAADGTYQVDSVKWRPVPAPASAANVDKWRAVVIAAIKRIK